MSKISRSTVIRVLLAWTPIVAVNLFTAVRVVLSPVVLVLALDRRWSEALFFLIISELTELFDGLLAQLLKATSAFGRKFDQVGDVFMTVSAALGLVVDIGGILPWVVIGVLSAISLSINITLNLLPRWIPSFKSTLGHALLNAFFPFSSIAVQLGILTAYILKADMAIALPFLFVIMLIMARVRKSRIDKWLEPIRRRKI